MLRGFKFVLIVMMLAVLAMISAIVTMHFAIHGTEVAVPDFKDLTVTQATSKAAFLNLNTSVENHIYSLDIPAGRIVNQFPAPGVVVRSEWHVRLTESLGPQRVAIPNLTGSDERLASIEIRRVGLELGQDAEMPDAFAAAGTVIAQNPKPNAPGVERPSVSLLVAADPAEVSSGFVMPDLTGQLFSSAALAVSRAGLKLAPVKEEAIAVPAVGAVGATAAPPPPVLAGSVTAQSPAAGHRVDVSIPIELTVAQ